MKELSLQEVKEIELGLLIKFDVFCKENGIRYFLSNGTLLGAVKYRGFIPWDDDIDVLVPREDYQKLISLFCDDEKFKLFSFEREREFRFPFAKLCDMRTRKIEENTDNGTFLGVDIDVFPLDCWDSNLKKAEDEVKHIRRCMLFLSWTKSVKVYSNNLFKRTAKAILVGASKLLGSSHFVKKIIKQSCRESQKDHLYLGCKSWPIYGPREIIPAEVFSDTVDIAFEGHLFPAPIGYDVYLRSLYGNYKQDPPVDKQKTHHRFVAYLM